MSIRKKALWLVRLPYRLYIYLKFIFRKQANYFDESEIYK
jgi:hypothetical protein